MVNHEDPRLLGISEQLERARLFLEEGRRSPDPIDAFRRLVASVYFSRAIVELMLEAADKQVVNIDREALDEKLAKSLPRYALLEKVRIHDFHRFGVVPNDGWFMGGGITLTARGGHAAVSWSNDGANVATTGASTVRQKRPLQTCGDRVLDDEAGEWLTLADLLDEFLAAIPGVIDEFQTLWVGIRPA